MSTNSDENIAWGWRGNWGLVLVAVHWKIWKCSPLCCIAMKCNIESAAVSHGGKNILQAAQRVRGAALVLPAGDFWERFWGYFNAGRKWRCRRKVKWWVRGMGLYFWFEIEDRDLRCWDFSMYTIQSCPPILSAAAVYFENIVIYTVRRAFPPRRAAAWRQSPIYRYKSVYPLSLFVSYTDTKPFPPTLRRAWWQSSIYTNAYLMPPVIV